MLDSCPHALLAIFLIIASKCTYLYVPFELEMAVEPAGVLIKNSKPLPISCLLIALIWCKVGASVLLLYVGWIIFETWASLGYFWVFWGFLDPPGPPLTSPCMLGMGVPLGSLVVHYKCFQMPKTEWNFIEICRLYVQVCVSFSHIQLCTGAEKHICMRT